MEQTLDVYLASREVLFRNPSDEAARPGGRQKATSLPPGRSADDGPQSPPAMARREAGLDIRAYTSRSRDTERAKLGLAPLKVRE
jgi:hypothetical protein